MSLPPVLYVELTPHYIDGRPLFVAAILLASWIGGFRAGVVATFGTAALALYYFTPPQRSLDAVKLRDGFLLGYIFMGLALNGFNLWRRNTERRLLAARDQLDRLHRTTAALLNASDVETVASATVAAAIRTMYASAGVVAVNYDDELVIMAAQGFSQGTSELWTHSEESPLKQAYFLQRPVLVRNYDQMLRLSEVLGVAAAKDGFESAIALPLTSRLRHGVLCIFFSSQQRFRRPDISLCETFANQSAQALDRLSLLASLSEQAANSNLLSETSRMLTETELQVDTIYAQLAAFCSEELASTAVVFRLTTDRCLEPVAFMSPDVNVRESGRESIMSIRLAFGEGLSGSVAETGRGRVYPAAAPELTSASSGDKSSAIAVPISTQAELLGVLLIQRNGGRTFDGSHAALLQDIGGRAALALVAARERDAAREELSLRKHAEEQLRRNQLLLEDALRVKDEFLGMVSHELRTPLTTIRGNADILKRRPELDQQTRTESLSDIVAGSDRLARIVENMLFLARLEIGKQLDLEPINLTRVVKSACEDFLRQAPEANLRLQPGPEEAIIAGNEDYIRQILENLLSNALKYSRRGTQIDISVAETEGLAVASVADRGYGIDATVAKELFEPFYRNPETAASTSGLGIGLTVCKRLAEAQGGHIEAKQREDGGTVFRFTVPILTALTESDHP